MIFEAVKRHLVGRRLWLSALGGLAMAAACWLVQLVLFGFSAYLPGMPSAHFLALVADAFSDQPGEFNDAQAQMIMAAVGWYKDAVLPLCGGILIGLSVGAVWRCSMTSLVIAGAAFAVLALGSCCTEAKVVGAFGFFFSLVGAVHLAALAREAIVSRRSPSIGD